VTITSHALDADRFRIDVGDTAIQDLKHRLDSFRRPRNLSSGWIYGLDSDYLTSLLTTWRHEYSWREHEAELNALPQYRKRIGNAEVHFFHLPGSGRSPMPLILTHGWPSSVVEYLPLAKRLAYPEQFGGKEEDAFSVVIPSLPGFGYSSAADSTLLSPQAASGVWVALMESLGYPRFAAHGCDVGAHVTALMGLNYPAHLIGVHMGSVPIPGPSRREMTRTPEEQAYLDRVQRWRKHETGYVEIQRTKPDTLAAALNDSPGGLAAWIAEKWRSWSDCGGTLESAVSRATLLTNISLYWFTGTIGTSMRYYFETSHTERRLVPGQKIAVPCGFLLEAPDVGADNRIGKIGRPGAPPRAPLEESYDIRRWTVAPYGGHFPAVETPDLLVDELRHFFGELR
jgi:pimeloyl-ACP methyl ester carboxylesterase